MGQTVNAVFKPAMMQTVDATFKPAGVRLWMLCFNQLWGRLQPSCSFLHGAKPDWRRKGGGKEALACMVFLYFVFVLLESDKSSQGDKKPNCIGRHSNAKLHL
ncbi:hypothetical protein PoB_004070100 [Plakobranchus ocellatus]|uniref:Uncharacterized protein n=1 Tax=Plakobranchus ocellatus TaxID=259542 RepID=A0AAV4B117_9GAST|nr:hypothetical protein PoB_004070100 [Plakobranchus ocellatus]